MSKKAKKQVEAATTSVAAIDVTALTPEQLKDIRKQLKDKGKEAKGSVAKRNAVIDPMLTVKDTEGLFVNTTSDILAKLQSEGVAPATLSDENRKWWLKAIQTRKQKLEKLEGVAVGTYGYKASANGFTLTVERVVDWYKSLDDKEMAKFLKATGLKS